jgi:hypothetical protein
MTDYRIMFWGDKSISAVHHIPLDYSGYSSGVVFGKIYQRWFSLDSVLECRR